MEVYQALYGTFETYARPLSMFVSPVDKQKYPQAKQKYRFQWVEFKKKEMLSADLTGDVERRVPIPEEGKQMRSISGMLSADLAGDAERRVPIPKEGKREAQNAANQQLPEPQPAKPLLTAEEKLLAFLDADTIEERYAILVDMRDEVTDRMINSMAVVTDVVIEEGPLDLRYEELKACLRTMQRYECSRLR